MNKEDFVDLNVPRLLNRYSNPSENWRQVVLAFASTQLSFFEKNGLLKPNSDVLLVPIEQVVIHFSDYTEEGGRFVKSGAVDSWLAACDRKGTVEAYKDSSGLDRRLKKFRNSGRAIPS